MLELSRTICIVYF